LNYKQIEDKKQKLSKKIILNLIYNARIVRNRNNTLSYLLINVKEPFNYISFVQFINIPKRLNMLRNIVNWVTCFLLEQVTSLAFNKNKQKLK